MAVGVPVGVGGSVKTTVGRGVLVGDLGRGVLVGCAVSVGLGVQDGTGVSVMATVGLGVGVKSRATLVGSSLLPKSENDGETNSTV